VYYLKISVFEKNVEILFLFHYFCLVLKPTSVLVYHEDEVRSQEILLNYLFPLRVFLSAGFLLPSTCCSTFVWPHAQNFAAICKTSCEWMTWPGRQGQPEMIRSRLDGGISARWCRWFMPAMEAMAMGMGMGQGVLENRISLQF